MGPHIAAKRKERFPIYSRRPKLKIGPSRLIYFYHMGTPQPHTMEEGEQNPVYLRVQVPIIA
jgi:hypothetical protein